MIMQILDASGSNLMDGVIAHVDIKGCCKNETFELLQYYSYFWDWIGFSNKPHINFPQMAKKAYGSIFLWYYER
jgi:hypothetical protein